MKKAIIVLTFIIFLLIITPFTVNAETTKINQVSFTGATAPIIGGKPTYSVTVSSEQHVSIQKVVWWNCNGPLNQEDTFKPGVQYTMIVYLIPDQGYSFDSPERINASLSGISSYSIAVESYGGDEKAGRAFYFYFITESINAKGWQKIGEEWFFYDL